MILFIKNISIEGPGTLGAFFESKGYTIGVVDLSRGESLPADTTGIEAVVVLGGPMNVYEEEKHTYLMAENELIRDLIQKQIPYLGLCLGSQLLAKAAGAQVVKSPGREIGFMAVQLTEAGRKDPLFKGLPSSFEVFQWHEDMSQLPADAAWLAMSGACPHQAFKIGPRAYGLQFHVEVKDNNIREWAEHYFPEGDTVLIAKTEKMLYHYQNIKDRFHAMARILYDNFLEIIVRSKQFSL